MRLRDGHGWKSGLGGRVRHQNLPRLMAKAPPASFLVSLVETRRCAHCNSSGEQNFAGI
jgi:hypothetical protein